LHESHREKHDGLGPESGQLPSLFFGELSGDGQFDDVLRDVRRSVTSTTLHRFTDWAAQV